MLQFLLTVKIYAGLKSSYLNDTNNIMLCLCETNAYSNISSYRQRSLEPDKPP